jgi:signal transduction histidine kinase
MRFPSYQWPLMKWQRLYPGTIAHTESIEKSKRELIANVSHDLRTPLTIIHGYVETFADERKHD